MDVEFYDSTTLCNLLVRGSINYYFSKKHPPPPPPAIVDVMTGGSDMELCNFIILWTLNYDKISICQK